MLFLINLMILVIIDPALVTVLSKVFGSLLKTQLYCYFEDNNLFTYSQFGFISGKPTSTAVLSQLKYVFEGFEDCQSMGAILCDLSN